MPRRRHWPACLALLLLTACVPTPNQQVGQSPTPEQRPADLTPLSLSIGWGVTPITASPASVLWLADDLGFYAREGLKPDLLLIQGTPNLVAGVRSGEVDVAVLTAYEAVLLTATKSIDLRMIGGSGASGQANTFMVVSRDSIGSLEALR